MSNQMHALYVPDGVTPSVHVPVRQADGTYSVPVACDGTGKLGVTGIAGGGGGSGDASAANQATQITRATEIRDRLDLPALSQIIDVASGSVTYVCEAAPGTASSSAAWRVQRISVSGNVTTIQWAGGGEFSQIADNRASLTYS